MKAVFAIIGLVIGVAITALVCRELNSARDAHRQVQLLSDVHDPLRQCLDDIVQTYERGNPALAEHKTRILQQRWSEYLAGGRAPERFMNEVMTLGIAATRPGD